MRLTYIHRNIPPFIELAAIWSDVLRQKSLQVSFWVQALKSERLQLVLPSHVHPYAC